MIFWGIAAALTLLALAFIAVPVLRMSGKPTGVEDCRREALNIALYREQFEELDQQHTAGALTEGEWHERQRELDIRLLEDSRGSAPVPQPASGRPVLLMIGLLFALPVLAGILYVQLGSWGEWQLTRSYRAINENPARGAPANDKLMVLLGDISRHAERSGNPDWLFLQAEASMQLGAYSAAADAFARLRQAEPDNADLIGRQVQALYLARGKNIDGDVNALMEEALAINPHQPTVLGIRGMNAFEKGDFPVAVAAWSQALAGLPPASPPARMLRQGIEQARTAMAGDAVPVATAGAPGPAPLASATAAGFTRGIRVRVELDSAARVQAGSIVYILAQSPGGGMPFAVVRLPVENLPTEVVLDDSTAMAPGSHLSLQPRVKVTARVSRSGNAMAQAGDWQGRSDTLTPATLPPVVSIRIDQKI